MTYWDQDSLNVETVVLQIELYRTSYYDIGEGIPDLVIENDTNSNVWFSLDDADTVFLESNENYRVFYQDNIPYQVEIAYNGNHVFSNIQTIILNQIVTENFEIEATGGAIKVTNNSQTTDIVAVYLAMNDDEFWGEEALNDILEFNESAIWTVTPGNWDVLIVNRDSIPKDIHSWMISISDYAIMTQGILKENEFVEDIAIIKGVSKDFKPTVFQIKTPTTLIPAERIY